MLGGGKMKAIYDLRAEGVGIREIARRLDLTRATVRKYLRSGTIPVAKPRPPRVSKLAPWAEYIVRRVRVDGVDNCSVLLEELGDRGYAGGRTVLKDFVQPLRLPKAPIATVRFETQPGEQAQVDFGTFRYRALDGKIQRVYAFVMDVRALPPARVRGVRGRAHAVSVRQHEGGRVGPGRGRAADLERPLPRLRAAGRVHGAAMQAVSGSDEGPG